MAITGEYQVVWYWRNPSWGATLRTDIVSATNAERAINKVRKAIGGEYAMRKSDMVIDAVLRVGKDVR